MSKIINAKMLKNNNISIFRRQFDLINKIFFAARVKNV